MSGSDGNDSSTQVPTCQVNVDTCGQVLSCQALNVAVS
jgi:hypothetical protein